MRPPSIPGGVLAIFLAETEPFISPTTPVIASAVRGADLQRWSWTAGRRPGAGAPAGRGGGGGGVPVTAAVADGVGDGTVAGAPESVGATASGASGAGD